jgi:hypothetical protein
MKILCVSDHKDPLIYSSGFKARMPDVELVLGAGDLDLDYYGFIVSSLNKPLLFVFGNHNLKDIHRYRKEYALDIPEELPQADLPKTYGSTYVGFRVRKVKGLLIAGLDGSKKYNNGMSQYTEFQMTLKILRMIPRLLWNRTVHGRYLDILLTHAPPRHIHDREDPCHKGFEIFKTFMKFFKPRYLIHGHVHLYDRNAKRRSWYMDTEIVNAYDHIVLEWENGNN